MGAPQYEQAGADVSGSGTPGTIPVWSSGTTLGDSIISQNNGTNRLLVAGGTAAAAANGTDLTFQSQAGGTGNTNGGNIFLLPGARAGSGAGGLIGLGTSAPKAPVHLRGAFNVYSPSNPAAPPAAGFRDGITAIFTNTTDSGYGLSVGVLGSGSAWMSSQRIDGIATTYDLLLQPVGGNVGIGTASPGQRLAVRSPDNVASTNVVRIESNNAAQAVLLRYSSIYGSGGNLDLGTDSTNDVVFKPNSVERARVTSAGNVQAGSGTTTMTDGFFYIPAAAGAPTGVPTAIAGRVPMYYDTTNDQFYIRNGANWRKVTLT